MAFRRGTGGGFFDPFDDPFFGGGMLRRSQGSRGGERQQDPFRAMEARMDAMMNEAFGGSMLGGGGFREGTGLGGRFGGGMLDSGMVGRNGGGGGGHASSFSFSSSTFSSSDGRGGTYTRQVTSRSNGGAAEVREAIHDGYRGEQSATVRRMLADGRGRTIQKSRKSDGTENHVDTLHNMEAEECRDFDSDWRASADSGFARLGGRGGFGQRAALGMGLRSGEGRRNGRALEYYGGTERGRVSEGADHQLHREDRQRGRVADRRRERVSRLQGGRSIDEID